MGEHEFTLVCDPPDFSTIPDPTGPTALLVAFTYNGEQFLHLGYNVLVKCTGDIPEEYTSASQLLRSINRCFPKRMAIKWDGDGIFPDVIQGHPESAKNNEMAHTNQRKRPREDPEISEDVQDRSAGENRA